MTENLVNSIAGRLSLRRPLAESLGILARASDIISLFLFLRRTLRYIKNLSATLPPTPPNMCSRA
jgi:hypothetical protein